MKKIYTQLFICLFILSNAYSQIPNASFEAWTPYSSTGIFGAPFSGEYPTGWHTTDSIFQYYTGPRSALREGINKCDLLYSIKLVSVSGLGNRGPGVATNGIITGISTISGGTPDTARSGQFTGCYRYVPARADSDTGYISTYLFRWNGSSRDTIASTIIALTDSNTTMISFVSNFTYKDWSHEPDTILIILQSGPGLNHGQSGSILYVDSLGLSGYVGISENLFVKTINIFPQPAQNELNVRMELNQNISLKYEIADITGRKILSDKLKSMNEKIDISALSRGNYFISLHNEQGAVLYSSKFIVSK